MVVAQRIVAAGRMVVVQKMVVEQRIVAVGRKVVVRRMVEAQMMVAEQMMAAARTMAAAGRMVVARTMVVAQRIEGRVQGKMVDLLVHLLFRSRMHWVEYPVVVLLVVDDIAEHRNRVEPLVLAVLDTVHNPAVLVEYRQHCSIDSNCHQYCSLVLFVHSRRRRLHCQRPERWLHLNFHIDEAFPVVDVDNLVLAVEPESLCASLEVVRMVQ